jgi:arabinogalactan endo-1,4-beta-galactosidase
MQRFVNKCSDSSTNAAIRQTNAAIRHLLQPGANHAARLQIVQEGGVDDIRIRVKVVPSSTISNQKIAGSNGVGLISGLSSVQQLP